MNRIILLFLAIFCINGAGAQTTPLWLRYPAISPDGNTIVFSYKGDLYKVPATGGTAVALTLHEAYDYIPWDFSTDDRNVIFGSPRNDVASSTRFPSNGVFQKLYAVPVKGGPSVVII